jgi:hypothetical protein
LPNCEIGKELLTEEGRKKESTRQEDRKEKQNDDPNEKNKGEEQSKADVDKPIHGDVAERCRQ